MNTATTWGPGGALVMQARPNRRVWLAKRRRLLGATDCTAILGYHPNRTPLDVWLDKTGKAGPDQVGATYEARRGHALEALLLDQWAASEGAELVRVPPLLAHPDYPMVGASLDGAGRIIGDITEALHVVDAKTAGWVKRDDWWDNPDDAPDHYVAQVLVQLAVSGAQTGWLAADVAGQYTCVGPIPRDLVWEAWALPLLADWWNRHVIGGEVPEADPVRDYRNLNRAWVPDPGEAIEATPDLVGLVRDYRTLRDEAKDAKAIADEAKGHLRIAMKTATRVLLPTDQEPMRLAYIDGRGALALPRKDPLTTLEDTQP